MSKRQPKREERRAELVEVNLLAENEGEGDVRAKVRRGCVLPFLGGGLLVLIVEAMRMGVG